MSNQKGFINIIILIVALIVIGGGGYYVYNQQQEKITTPTTQSSDQAESEKSDNEITTTKQVEGGFKGDIKGDLGSIKTDINIKTDATQTVDCGSEDCFQQKFATCQPATLKADVDFASVDYKIIGPATGGCKMTFKYTTNPNPEWVNKEMTCTFDSKINFQKSMENVFNGVIDGSVVCTGPLYNILKSL